MSRREPLPRKPTASRKEDQKGFFEFKHAHDVHKKAKAAEEAAASTARAEAVRKAAEAAEAEAAKASRKMRKRKKKDEGVDVEAVAVAAGRKARKAVHAQALAEWRDLSAEEQAEWAAKEEALASAYEAARACRDAAEAVPPTEYRMKLRDPSMTQLLMRLPADGFKAFTTFGVYGQREQRASLQQMNMSYDVEGERLTVSTCTVAF